MRSETSISTEHDCKVDLSFSAFPQGQWSVRSRHISTGCYHLQRMEPVKFHQISRSPLQINIAVNHQARHQVQPIRVAHSQCWEIAFQKRTFLNLRMKWMTFN
jgi:hypothetical protein